MRSTLFLAYLVGILSAISISTSSTMMKYVNHMPATETCSGFSVEAPPPVEPFHSPLYSAATTGNIEEVNTLLLEPAKHNVYETDDNDESLLSRVMRNKHEVVAQRILDEYEHDLKPIETFFSQHNVPSAKWLGQRILVSLGSEQSIAVRGHVTDAMRLPWVGQSKHTQGLLVLLKHLDDDGRSEVLWLGAGEPGSDRALARIVDLIYQNGMIDVLQEEHDERSLLDVAARNGLNEVFFRLDRIFGDGLRWNGIKYVRLMCYMANYDENRIDTIKALVMKLGRFDLNSVYQEKDAWRLLEIPMKLEQLDVFDHFLNEITRVSSQSTTQVLNDLIRNSIYFSLHAQSKKYKANLKSVTPYLYSHNADLLVVNQVKPIYNWRPLLLVLDDQSDLEPLAAYLNENLDIIAKEKLLFNQVISCLVLKNRLDVLERWNYLSSSVPPNILFGLSWRINDMDMLTYLFKAIKDQESENSLMQKVVNFAKFPNATSYFKLLLAHPKCLDVTKMSVPDTWTPMAYALVAHRPENYRVMFESVNRKEDIANVKEHSGMNLLAAAIFNRKPVWSTYDSEYGDPYELEYLDDVDEEDGPSEAPTLNPDEEEQLRVEYNNIFDELLQLGADPHVVSEDGLNLIHIAVICDNLWAVKTLLGLGVDPNLPSVDGNRPIHLVKSIQMYKELMPALPNDIMTVTNKKGYTPLSEYCTSDKVVEKDEQLMDIMLALGGNVASRNARDQSTPLHRVGNDVQLAKWILKHGADVNAQDNQGFTPLHEASIRVMHFEVMKELLNVSNLDLNVVTGSKVSYLAGLVRLTESQFDEIRPVIERRQAEFDKLFEEQCNSLDDIKSPIIHTAIRSDTNDYCLQKLLDCEHLNKDGLALSAICEPKRMRMAMDEGAGVSMCQSKSSLLFAIGNKGVGMKSYPESLRMLLANGVSAVENDSHGQKPLQTVFHMGNGPKAVIEIAAALIGAGADYRAAEVVEDVRQSVLVCLLEDGQPTAVEG